MAKEKETKVAAEKAAPATTVVSSENIRESLDNASLGSIEMAKNALEKIKKDRDEKTQKEMMVRFQKASYRVDQGYLKLRRERDIEKIQKEELVHRDRLARLLMGWTVTEEKLNQASKAEDTLFEKETIDVKAKTVTVVLPDKSKKTFKVGEEVPPVIDYVDYDTLFEKITENTRKQTQKADDEHNQYTKKLDAKYGDYWAPSWKY